jgi:hypothetical protein
LGLALDCGFGLADDLDGDLASDCGLGLEENSDLVID